MKQNTRMPVFRDNLRELMGDLSVTDFAQKIGLSRQTVGFYLNGDRIPDCETLAQICSKCQVSANWLIGLSDVKSPSPNIAAINQLTGLSEFSIQRLIEVNKIRQQESTNQRIDEILKDEAYLEKMHIEAILKDEEANTDPEIQIILDELGLSSWQDNKELVISTAVNNRIQAASKDASYIETIMLDALNYLIEGEESHNALYAIALYLLTKPYSDRYLRLHTESISALFLHMDDDLFLNALLLEIEAEIKELRKRSNKHLGVTVM